MPKFWHDLGRRLAGWPDEVLTLLCAIFAAGFAWLAVYGSAPAKATAILYAVFP